VEKIKLKQFWLFWSHWKRAIRCLRPN